MYQYLIARMALVILLLSSILIANAQDQPEWVQYFSSSAVGIMTADGENIWAGLYPGGCIRINTLTDEIVYFDTGNSGLPSDYVYSILVDFEGAIWFITRNGLARLANESWTVYNESNSELPSNAITSIALDASGNKWIGTMDGLAQFNDTSWVIYDTTNSELPYNEVTSVAFDDSGSLWVASQESTYDTTGPGGFNPPSVVSHLVKYDGMNWSVGDSLESTISSLVPDHEGNIWGITGYFLGRGDLLVFDGMELLDPEQINICLPVVIGDLSVDNSGNIWLLTVGPRSTTEEEDIELGLIKYDGTDCISYAPANPSLVHELGASITIDEDDNKWIGSEAGIFVFNENGNVVEIDNGQQIKSQPSRFILNQNYPNPFNPNTTIRYALPEQATVSLTVYDVRGQKIAILPNGVKAPGNYEVQWNGLDQSGNPVSTGVYFCQLQSGTFSQTIKMVYLR